MIRVSLFCVLFGGWMFLAACQHKCKSFKFTGLTDNVFDVQEYTQTTFMFKVIRKPCNSLDDVIVKVSKKDRDDGRYRDFCQIFLGDEYPCQNITRVGQYQYQLKWTFDRQDNVTWLWTASNKSHEAVDREEIVFNIQYPPSVTSLQFNTEEVQSTYTAGHNSSVDIVCNWDEGNPPVTARLLDRHGVEMEGSIYSSGQIRYRFPAVGCQDAGLIRCEAAGASLNKSATLLVRYSPKFNKSLVCERETEAGKNCTMAFPFRSCTKNFTGCTLERVDMPQKNGSTPEPSHKHCSSFSRVTGTPPDLTLTVRLDDVTKQDEGQWTLTLTNDMGQEHVEFILNITQSFLDEDSEVTATLESAESRRVSFLIDDQKIVWIVSGSVGGLILIVAATVAMTLLCVRKCGTAAMNQPTGQPVIIRSHAAGAHGTSAGSSQESRQSVHLYFEVRDSDVQSIGEDLPPPRNGSRRLPDGRERGITSRDETEEERAQRNTAHFYENTHMMSMGTSGSFDSQLQGEAVELSEIVNLHAEAENAGAEGSGANGTSVSNANVACGGQPQGNADNDRSHAELVELLEDELPVEASDAEMEDEYVGYLPRLYENTKP